ncbi:hypothetical protein BG011_000460 [Mortierella polycephala]|uniref:Uncharacterized protein n=1 Tax=Mortierella polycephala TaxID=41804 RepID=A0A9P6QFN6_9FUNG|nr:hypothetical protein BG011_000460 [Mortierella polycephala]
MRSGEGVTSDDQANNFDELLNQKRYGYTRMEVLFGKSPHLQPSLEASSGRGQLTFNSRNKNYTVRGSDDPDPDVGDDDDDIENDWVQVAGDRGEEDDDDENRAGEEDIGEEEREEDEILANNRRFSGKTFAAYRSKDSAQSSASRSTSRRSFERLVSPGKDKEAYEGFNVRKNPPVALHDHQPLERDCNELEEQRWRRDDEKERARLAHEEKKEYERLEREDRKEKQRLRGEQTKREHELVMLNGQLALTLLQNGALSNVAVVSGLIGSLTTVINPTNDSTEEVVVVFSVLPWPVKIAEFSDQGITDEGILF